MKRIKTARTEMADINTIGSSACFFDKEPRKISGMKKKSAKPKVP